MVRPRKCRNVSAAPEITYFKPRGVPLRELAEVYLPLDGYEAIRLADLEGLSHEEAARQMHVSRQTFGRIVASARQTLAKAIVNGLALRIHGGDYQLSQLNHLQQGDEAMAVHSDVTDTVSVKEQHTVKKIAITSEGPTLDDPVDPRFGRAAGFIIVDLETMDFKYQDNGASQARAQGAGIHAAEVVSQAGVDAVLTGFVGPKAFQALAATGVQVAQDLENMTVREAIERLKKGEVEWSDLSQAKGMGR